MIASATQIRIEGVRGFFNFVVHLSRVKKQLVGYPGLVSVRFNLKLQTLTVWDDEQAMKAFRNSGAHLAAMKNTRKIGRAKVVTWQTKELPSWQEAGERLAAR